MCKDDFIVDDLIFPTSEENFVNVDEIQAPQNGKLIRGTFGTFSKEMPDVELSSESEGG